MPYLCHFKGRPCSNLEVHRETAEEEDVKPFVCDRCHFIASDFLGLDAHKSTCGNNYKCSSCLEIFSNSNLLELHRLSHAEVVKYDLVFSSNGEIHMETTPLDQRLANPIKKEFHDLHNIKVEPPEPVEVKQEAHDVKCDIKIKTEDKSFQEFDAMMKLSKKERNPYKEDFGYSCTRYYKMSKVKLLKNVQWKNDKEYQKLRDVKMEYDPSEDLAYTRQLREEITARSRAIQELRKMNDEAVDSTEVRARKREKIKESKSKNKKVTEADDAVEKFQDSSNDKSSRKRDRTRKADSGTRRDTEKKCKNNNIAYEDGLYRCEFCDYSNEKIHSVKIHRMVHTVEKPFWCPMCPKTFRQRSHLQNHRVRHPKSLKSFHLLA